MADPVGIPGEDPGVEQWVAKVAGERVAEVEN